MRVRYQKALPSPLVEIRIFDAGDVLAHLDSFVALLQDAVASGASVGFLPPLAREDAEQFWRDIAAEVEKGHRVVVGAMEGELVGTVQLALATKPNARHRAEVQKLLVHTSRRGRGIARQLMEKAEAEAAARRRSLLVLDTVKGDTAERLYPRIGYERAGEIPFYARNEAGELETTVVFYKKI
jgi:acetyltransferase